MGTYIPKTSCFSGHTFVKSYIVVVVAAVAVVVVILYTYLAHQTIKLFLMRGMRVLTEQECFMAG